MPGLNKSREELPWLYYPRSNSVRVINSHFGSTPALLLDTFSGAAGAWSLRQLRTGVTNVCRVRRSSDNTLQDFSSVEVTDGTLATFCGAGNGFVHTLYAQNSGGTNLVQTTNANQPQIVTSGSVNTINGKPALTFTGSQWMTASFTLGATVTGYVVCRSETTAGAVLDRLASNNANSLYYDSGTIRLFNGSGFTASFTNATQNLVSFLSKTSSSFLRVNGSQTDGTVSGTTAMNGVTVGVLGGTSLFRWVGTVQEVVVWNSDDSANVSGVESNINTHYSIY